METFTKPYQTRASDLKPAWHVVDAEGKTLGRLSTEIAVLLQGKHKPSYVPYLNTGDFVIVTNAEKIRVTGKKLEQKIYYRHSGYPGGLTQQTLAEVLRKAPTRVIKRAVKGMLPKNTMGKHMLSRLKAYAGESHPHEAQINAQRRAQDAPETAEQGTEEA
jgi:large subunit ribosomal protein L13